jgi:LmbE family N-acetylglucosaminyl deacetylase
MKNVLFLSNDVNSLLICCGGTIALYARQGHHVTAAIYKSTLLDPQRSVLEALGTRSIHTIGVDETGRHLLDLVKTIESLKRAQQPDIVYLPRFDASQKSHCLFDAATAAFRPQPRNNLVRLYLYSKQKPKEQDVTTFIDISPVLNEKRNALKKISSIPKEIEVTETFILGRQVRNLS